jgi:UDP-GlcNAc:undecaprenyl-phosphate GlcNAc-1-phosphate transferase
MHNTPLNRPCIPLSLAEVLYTTRQNYYYQKYCIMTQFLLIGITALLFAIIATPIARRIALRIGVVDAPSQRKIHSAPVPLLGGAAIYLACVGALVLFGERFYIRELIAILLAATLVSLCGLADDRWTLHAYPKLLGQALAAVILVIGGIQVQLFTNDTYNIILTIIWVVGITNAMNLLDNMDGLSSGVATVCGAFFLLLAAQSGQILVSALAAGLMGACIGFLRYNLNPATIFMGDTGSLFLGLFLAVLGIKLRFPANQIIITWMVPLCVLALPILDTTLVSISRLRRGKNPLTHGGKDHISHRLVQLGLTRREAVLTCYLLAGVGGMVASYVARANTFDAYIAVGCLIGLGIWGIVYLEQRAPIVEPAPQI